MPSIKIQLRRSHSSLHKTLSRKIDQMIWLRACTVYSQPGGVVVGVCVCVCVVIPFILDIRFVDVPAEVTQEESHTGSLHLPCAERALIFLARRTQPLLSLVDREVEFNLIVLHLLGNFLLLFLGGGK